MIEPYAKYGGMHAAGLSHVDMPTDPSVMGGDTQNVYFKKIATIDGSTANRFNFEPKTAQAAAEQLIAAYATRALLNAPIEPSAVVTEIGASGPRIRGITTALGLITGKVFIDASYEGDLMAGAVGASGYTYGRESAAQYGETSGGFLGNSHGTTVSGLSGIGYPFVADPGETDGQADRAVQAYNFRLPLTRTASNRLPFPKPSGYATSLYQTQLQIWAAQGITTFMRDGSAQSLGLQSALPKGKLNWNSADLVNGNIGYADGSWSKRRDVTAAHVLWQQGLMWCIVNDPIMASVGLSALQADAQDCGLCADEFTDSTYGAGWPFWLYARETRRLKAMTMVTANDMITGGTLTKATSIGRWAYNWDAHMCSAFTPAGSSSRVVYEGHLTTNGASGTYQIPAECLMPPQTACTNLIVPVCAGFSHVAWAPQRLEMAQGVCGEAAGEIAAWAVDTGQPVQTYSYAQLSANLTAFGTVL